MKPSIPKSQNQLQALVTGSTGFLGRHLTKKLLDQGWKVYALYRSEEKIKNIDPKAIKIKGDITQLQQMILNIPHNLDAIFNTAASTNTWYKNNPIQTETNVQGMKNLIELCKKINCRKFIHLSSVVTYGVETFTGIHNIQETDPKAGLGSWINYVKTKSLAEQELLKQKQLFKVIVNPTHIIGPQDQYNWAKLFKMIANKTLPSIPTGAGSFVDVRDVAQSVISAYHNGEDGENYLLGGTNLEFKEFIDLVAKQLNVSTTKIKLPYSLLILLAHIKNFVSKLNNKEPEFTPESISIVSDRFSCNSEKAKKQLQHNIRNIDESIKDTIEYLKSENIIT